MGNSEKPRAKAQQSQLFCWQQTVIFPAEVPGFCDEINDEFETSGKYNVLVSQTTRPIAKSLPKTLHLKSTIFEHRIGFLRQITYTKHSRSVFMLGTKSSGNTSSTTCLSTPSVYHAINDFGGNHNTSEDH